MSFYQLLLISVTLNVTGNIFLKKGVISFGGISGNKSNIVLELSKAAANPFILGGLVLYGLSFLIWLRVLTFSDLSKSYPIFATFVFLFTTLGSMKFLNEEISQTRVVGLLVMLIGIFIVSRS